MIMYVSKYFSRIILLVILVSATFFSITAQNNVKIISEDTVSGGIEKLELKFRGISNDKHSTDISMKLTSENVPFSIHKIEWKNMNKTLQPLEPFSMDVDAEEVANKKLTWQIDLNFPLATSFSNNDMLLLYTDKGIVRCPTSREGELKESFDLLNQKYDKEISSSKESSRKAWRILIATICVAVIGGGLAYLIVRRKLKLKKEETEHLMMLISEGNVRNKELEEKVDQLYGNRLNTLNMLCNEYFEKNDSEKVKLSLYNEVEKHILSLRDRESISSLEEIVNRYLDNILTRVKEQLPELGSNDILFLTYLYAGFSPRAVCIFTDIKIKNFYNRRSRLKERILNSYAPDKDFFVSKM